MERVLSTALRQHATSYQRLPTALSLQLCQRSSQAHLIELKVCWGQETFLHIDFISSPETLEVEQIRHIGLGGQQQNYFKEEKKPSVFSYFTECFELQVNVFDS